MTRMTTIQMMEILVVLVATVTQTQIVVQVFSRYCTIMEIETDRDLAFLLINDSGSELTSGDR
jgi:hypothetical protein